MGKLRKINLSEGYPLGWMQGEGVDYYYVTDEVSNKKPSNCVDSTKKEKQI
jgi:hypothetical protein